MDPHFRYSTWIVSEEQVGNKWWGEARSYDDEKTVNFCSRRKSRSRAMYCPPRKLVSETTHLMSWPFVTCDGGNYRPKEVLTRQRPQTWVGAGGGDVLNNSAVLHTAQHTAQYSKATWNRPMTTVW